MGMEKYHKIVLILFLFCFTILFMIHTKPVIKLNGADYIEIGLNEKYKEKGAKGKLLFRELKEKIKITDNIDTRKIGIYKVTYKMTYKNQIIEKIRTVRVVDYEKPKIELIGKKMTFVCPNTLYQEEGFKAIDNYDGDITNKVEIDVKKNKITYTVSDSSNNKTFETRKLIYKDTEKPNINLEKGNTITSYLNESFVDPGYKATDNCSEDITNKVKVTGTIDPKVLGEQILTYTVEDEYGNEAITKRIVNVIAKPVNADKTIYLTFDDGPSSTITPGILSILKEENIKATFFVINHDSKFDYLIKQAYTDGHTIGLHSYTHNYAEIYASSDAFFNDLYKIQDKVKKITGKKITIMRFPGGSSNTISRRYNTGIMTFLTNEVQNKGFQYFDWNVSSGDSGEVKAASEVYRKVTQNLTKKTNIVLLHDYENNYKTLESLRDIIRYGKENGYNFDSINKDTFPAHHGINN